MMPGTPAPLPHVVVATHGHCFDGAASAAVFSRLVQHLEGRPLRFSYVACGYGPARRPVGAEQLRGDINALLDYRYTQAPSLHWYFDHHATAFPSEGDRGHFDADTSGRRFHDPDSPSCAGLVARIARSDFGFHDPVLDELVRWADIIDAARFASAAEAIAREHPVLHLMTVLEHQGGASLLQRLVPRLATEPVVQVATSTEIQHAWKRLAPKHRAFIERVRSRSQRLGDVVYVDLTDEKRDVVGKFVTYALYPESRYSIVLSRARSKLKISVGFNPWCCAPRAHDVGAVCALHGGGGHGVVGAVSLSVEQLEQARTAVRQIILALSEPPT